MEQKLLGTYLLQAEAQCRFAIFAAEQIRASLGDHDAYKTFFAIQNLLNAAANIAKIFWGQRGAKAEARIDLRTSVDLSDDSPLRQVIMRNNFEHVDERIERWWVESPSHSFFDMNVGPSPLLAGAPINDFRHFNPATWELKFWGESFQLAALVAAVESLLPKVREAQLTNFMWAK